MKKNLSKMDGGIRRILAVVIAVLFFTKIISGVSGILLLGLGIILVLTSLISFCPIYYTLGISSRKEIVDKTPELHRI